MHGRGFQEREKEGQHDHTVDGRMGEVEEKNHWEDALEGIGGKQILIV